MCPTERNVLKEFYLSAKGSEWTDSANWIDPYKGHCSWQGITCDSNGAVVELNLASNGLSGKLTTEIVSLPSLEVLDLSDNDIKVSKFY